MATSPVDELTMSNYVGSNVIHLIGLWNILHWYSLARSWELNANKIPTDMPTITCPLSYGPYLIVVMEAFSVCSIFMTVGWFSHLSKIMRYGFLFLVEDLV